MTKSLNIARYFSLITLLTALCLPMAARAEVSGEEALKLLDQALTRADDQHFVYDLITKEPGKALRKLVLDVRVKGTKLRRSDFLAPGDVKGMKALVLSQDKMYIYLPAYRKVRRVAGHVQNQGFMGTCFSHHEMTTTTYSKLYTAKVLRETATHWILEVSPKPGKEAPYTRIEIDLLKDMHHPSEIRYFNAKGEKLKTETRTGYTCTPTPAGQLCNYQEAKMVSHVRNNAWSKFVRTKWEVNTGVSKRYFTLRSLQRGM